MATAPVALAEPFQRLDLDTIDASSTTTLGGQTVRIGALSARGLKAFRRMRGADPDSPAYLADEAIVTAEVFPDLTPDQRDGMDAAAQAYALICAWQASEAALQRALAATFGGAAGNGRGAGDAAPSTASPTST